MGTVTEYGNRKKKLDARARRNLAIIRAEVSNELDRGFEFADGEIGKLHTGLGVVFSPFVKLAYQFGARDQLRARGIAQLNVLLQCTSEYYSERFINNDVKSIEEAIERIIEDNFDDYLFYDETFMRSRQSHPRLGSLKKVLRKVFRSRLKVIVTLAEGVGETYNDLVRSTLSRQEATSMLGLDLEHTRMVLKLVEKEKDLLDIPSISRKDVIKMLHVSYRYTQKRLSQRIDEIYNDPKS